MVEVTKDIVKSNTKKNVAIRYNAFVDEYINNGFNASKAYLDVYKCKESVCRESASRLLTNVKIKKILSDKLQAIGLEEYVSREVILQDIESLIDTTTSPQVKARMIELKAKIAGMLKEDTTTINLGIFGDVSERVDDIYLKRGV